MERLICLVVGYFIGTFQSGYLYGKSKKMDIRNYGSGNSGSTNVLRVMGVRAGAIVFLGDAGKMILACLLTRFAFRSQPDMVYLYLFYTGLGVVLGHDFPFFMNFKGGKGVASTAGLIASTDWRVTLLCLAAFVCVVGATRFVSLGSIIVMLLFFASETFFALRGDFGLNPDVYLEFTVLAAIIPALSIWRHRSNIRRLLSGTENRLGAKKQ